MADGVDTVCEILDVLDTLLLVARADRAPIRAVALLELARKGMHAYLEPLDGGKNNTARNLISVHNFR